MTQEHESAVALLEKTNNFKVLRRFDPSGPWGTIDPTEPVATGIVVDVETTGLSAATDKIIELAMVKFEYGRASGTIGRILGTFEGFEDPGIPIPPMITEITGITDRQVEGHSFDVDVITAFVADANLVVAHNATLDRAFCEKRFPLFAEKDWACSLAQGPWTDLHFGSGKLEFLAMKAGYFYDAHRALVDAMVTLHVLGTSFAGQPLPMAYMLSKARRPDFRLWATRAPYEAKDILKARGYRWNDGENGDPKAWWKDVGENDVDTEKRFLGESIYGKMPPAARKIVVDAVTAKTRFSGRAGARDACVQL